MMRSIAMSHVRAELDSFVPKPWSNLSPEAGLFSASFGCTFRRYCSGQVRGLESFREPFRTAWGAEPVMPVQNYSMSSPKLAVVWLALSLFRVSRLA